MIIASSFDMENTDLWNNRAFQYGDGLFETMRMCNGHIPLWNLHLKRLNRGLKKLSMACIDDEFLNAVILHNCPSNMTKNWVIKLVVFRANQARTYQPHSQKHEWLISASEFKPELHPRPLNLAIAKQCMAKQPALAGMKHLNRLEQVMIANELNEFADVDDLLVLNHKGRIVETTSQNTVMIKDDCLYTPQLKHSGVKGVALDWLKSIQTVSQINIRPNELADCDGLMTCNAIKGFSWVAKIKTSNIKESISFGISNPIHDKIAKQWAAVFNS